MSTNRPDLPDFTQPPVNEVALTVQFQTLSALRSIHFGYLWERLGRDLFTSVEEQPPIPRSIERFPSSAANAFPQFQFLNMAPLPRYLFVSDARSEIVQVQQDRFTYNWTRHPARDYPRYEAVEADFLKFARIFEDFIREENLGSIKIDQAEVTYVNMIPEGEFGKRVERVISVLSGDYRDGSLGDPEQIRLSMTFPLIKAEVPFGRLHMDAFSSAQVDSPGLNLVLLARGKPTGTDINSSIDFLRAGRAAIVKAFASLTSEEMHKIWGRTDHAPTSG